MSKARKISSFGKSTHEYKKAILYCRVSSDRQKNEGHGLDSQEHRCREYARSKGYEVSEKRIFKDSFTGGGDFMLRPAMSALIGFVDNNPHEKYAVIFDDMSRFARDVNSHFRLRQEFDSREIKIECPNFTFEDTPEGELVETMMAAQHQYHRKNNTRQVIQKQRARLEAGYWAFGSRKAYKMVKDALHGNLSVPKQPEAAYLKEALEGFADGTFLHKVDACRFLVEKGYWSKQKPERYIDKFTELLKDPFFAGYIEYPKWEVARRKGHHEGLISETVFTAIQRRLSQDDRGGKPRIDVSRDFPLRRLTSCEGCGKSLTGAFTRGNGGKYAYYKCQNSDCDLHNKSLVAEKVHSEFDDLLKTQVLKKDVGKLVELIFDRVWEVESTQVVASEIERESTIKDLHEKISQLTSVAINAKSNAVREVYEKQIEQHAKEIETLDENSIKSLDLNIPYQTALEKSIGLLRSPYKIWHSVDIHEKQKIFFLLFDEKLVYSKKAGYQTDKLPSAVRLFEDFVTSNSQDVEMWRVELQSESMRQK